MISVARLKGVVKANSRLPCQGCRSRKKRCYHDGSNKDEDAIEEIKDILSSEPASEPTREPTPSPGRVSEYNPESVLEELSGSTGQLPLEPAVPVQEALEASQRLKRVLVWYKRQKRTPVAPKLSDNHRRYLQEAGAFLQLPTATTDALLPVYLSSLDDLVPVMDGAKVFREYSNGHASGYLARAMCLAVCKTRQAAPFLRLTADGPVLKPLEFGSKVLKGLDAALKADLERDRVTKVQILALMHLYNDGLGGVDRSSSYLSQAINEAWAMSLHWNIHGNTEQQQTDRLWWSLRNFDRLNKPIMGAAPFMIDDADIGIERAAVQNGDYRSEILSISLLLGDLMKAATRLYRATCKVTVDDSDSFPSLSELTVGIDFDQFHRSHKCKSFTHLTAPS